MDVKRCGLEMSSNRGPLSQETARRDAHMPERQRDDDLLAELIGTEPFDRVVWQALDLQPPECASAAQSPQQQVQPQPPSRGTSST